MKSRLVTSLFTMGLLICGTVKAAEPSVLDIVKVQSSMVVAARTQEPSAGQIQKLKKGDVCWARGLPTEVWNCSFLGRVTISQVYDCGWRVAGGGHECRRKQRAGLSGDRRAMKPAILGTFLVALASSGCQSMLQQPKDLGNEREEKVFDVTRGIDQIRDAETGETFYVICESCAKSTLKMRYRPPLPPASTMVPTEPIPVSPVPDMVQDTVPALISMPDTESAGQPASFQYMIPFAFGRSMLGPLGREAMEDVLLVAKEARCVHVRGHTDIIGKMPGNKRLAIARAAEIRAYLVKRGISADKLSISYCVDCFSDSNETTAGRTANRRAVVEMRPLLEAGDPTHPDLQVLVCKARYGTQVYQKEMRALRRRSESQ